MIETPPCIWCGGATFIVSRGRRGGETEIGFVACRSDTCGACGPDAPIPEEAVAAFLRPVTWTDEQCETFALKFEIEMGLEPEESDDYLRDVRVAAVRAGLEAARVKP